MHPGKFYALPQAPQQFKQLSWWRASTAISRSRRASATRMPAPTARPGEFYQLDLEMSFVTQEDVFAAVEPVFAGVFEDLPTASR